MKVIINRNNKGQLHGYQEIYRANGELWGKYFFNNGVQIDYEEFYWGDGQLENKNFYI